MKFKIMFFVLVLMFVGLIIASPAIIDKPSYNLVFEKNNSQVQGNVQLLMWNGNNMQVIGYNFDANEKYALVYVADKKLPNTPVRKSNTGVGSSYTNGYPGPATKPAIVCLKEMTSDEYGLLGSIFVYNYMNIATDKKNQTFWLVKSSDVVCKTNRAVKWNSNNYFSAEQKI